MNAPAKSDRELAILWDRLSTELQSMGEQAQQIALLLSQKAPSYDELSMASDLLQTLKNCVDAAKGARGLMLMSVHRQSRRPSA